MTMTTEITSKKIKTDWQFWFYWIMATSAGWLAGNLFFNVLPVIIAGGLIAGFQFAVLYQRVHKAWQWIPLSFLGWLVGNIISIIFFPEIMTGLLMGLTTGIAQWLFLRTRVILPGWWIIISIVGWTTGLTLMPGSLTSGTLPGAITGFVLMILIGLSDQNPKTQSTQS